jgi:hypothetical protein
VAKQVKRPIGRSGQHAESVEVEDHVERRARFATFTVAVLAALIAFAMNRVQIADSKNGPRLGPAMSVTTVKTPPTPAVSVDNNLEQSPSVDSEVQFGS